MYVHSKSPAFTGGYKIGAYTPNSAKNTAKGMTTFFKEKGLAGYACAENESCFEVITPNVQGSRTDKRLIAEGLNSKHVKETVDEYFLNRIKARVNKHWFEISAFQAASEPMPEKMPKRKIKFLRFLKFA